MCGETRYTYHRRNSSSDFSLIIFSDIPRQVGFHIGPQVIRNVMMWGEASVWTLDASIRCEVSKVDSSRAESAVSLTFTFVFPQT